MEYYEGSCGFAVKLSAVPRMRAGGENVTVKIFINPHQETLVLSIKKKQKKCFPASPRISSN